MNNQLLIQMRRGPGARREASQGESRKSHRSALRLGLHLELKPLRKDAADLIRWASDMGVPAYTFVNNRFEGCAPKTIDGILEGSP